MTLQFAFAGRLGACGLAGVIALACVDPASAQSATFNRTFVSGLGLDNSTCNMPSRPCRTFAYAMGNTAAGGSIVAQDAAEYGPVSITQAVSILGSGTATAKITVPSGGTGININAAGAAVILRGLEIAGGDTGINADAVGTLDISAVVVSGPASVGISLQAGATALHNSSVSAGNIGINVNGGSLIATRVTLLNSPGAALVNNGAAVTFVISTAAGTGGILQRSGTLFVKSSVIANSAQRGIEIDSGTTTIDTTTVVGSAQFDIVNSATTNSYGNNNFGTTSGTITRLTPN